MDKGFIIKIDIVKGEDFTCPSCGTNLKSLMETSYVGCEKCYEVFEEYLDSFIKRNQFTRPHQGKFPMMGSSKGKSRKRINLLKKELKEEVAKENFERAAKIRDEINLLTQVEVNDND